MKSSNEESMMYVWGGGEEGKKKFDHIFGGNSQGKITISRT
jgi:hypothetical protein